MPVAILTPGTSGSAAVTSGLLALGLYLALGALFAVPFVIRWAGRLDPDAAAGSWGFRLLVFPGCVALWLLLALRLRSVSKGRSRGDSVAERTPHREAARERSPGSGPGHRERERP